MQEGRQLRQASGGPRACCHLNPTPLPCRHHISLDTPLFIVSTGCTATNTLNGSARNIDSAVGGSAEAASEGLAPYLILDYPFLCPRRLLPPVMLAFLLLSLLSVFLPTFTTAYYVGPGVPYQLNPAQDWLVHPEAVQQSSQFLRLDNNTYKLTNGLISRTFTLVPNFATIGYQNEVTGLSYFRAPKPEATFSIKDGSVVFTVGGIGGTDNNQALWQPYYYQQQIEKLPYAYTYVSHSVMAAKARFHWTPQRWSELRDWPPRGVRVEILFAPPAPTDGPTLLVSNLTVTVVYELYDGMPVMQKYLQFNNNNPVDEVDGEEEEAVEELDVKEQAAGHDEHRHSHSSRFSTSSVHSPSHSHSHSHTRSTRRNRPVSHTEAAYAAANLTDNPDYDASANPYVFTNTAPSRSSIFIFTVTVELLACPEHACDAVMTVETDAMPRHTQWDPRMLQDVPFVQTTIWYRDDAYGNNDNDGALQGDAAYFVTLLSVSYLENGPSLVLPAGEQWETFRVLELCHDSQDEERQTLARRRWMRTLAPQGTENPIYWHLESQNNIFAAIDETVRVGFEMVIMSYGSGFNPQSTNASYVAWMKSAVEYAHSKNILIGGYTLMQNPNYYDYERDGVMVPSTVDGGGSSGIACFATEGHRQYRESLIAFINATGIDMLETDGPYEGSPCNAVSHEYHRGLHDSQAAQDMLTQDFYRSLKVRDIYFTVPDPYWLSAGTNKEPIGYTDRWTGSSYNKWERLDIGRMYAYDGTVHYPPTMGWMVFNYENYYPLNDNAIYYEKALAQYLGNGIVTCFRGQNLYDTDLTANLTRYWGDFYKAHRTVLNGDILHVVRPNGQQVDVQMHVHPSTWPYSRQYTNEVALGFFNNPLPYDVTRYTTRLSLYYAGVQPFDVIAVQWGTGIMQPWVVKGTVRAVVDESYGVDVSIQTLPANAFCYFIITVVGSQPRAARP